MLINSHQERMERQSQRHAAILRWLRDETWTSAAALSLQLNVSLSSTCKSLKQLQLLGHVIRHELPAIRQVLWGITPQGLAYAWADGESMELRPHFEPSKLAPLAVAHHLSIQAARSRAEQAGWSNWIPGARLPAGLDKRPDAVAHNPLEQSIALELERTIKTAKRYQAIFALYLQAIRRGDYQSVHYVCPDKRMAQQLTRLFALVKEVPVMGRRVAIDDKHRARFPVYCLDEWPPTIPIISGSTANMP